MYFPSFKWLRSKFEKKVANSGTLTNSQNENPLIVVEFISNIIGHLLFYILTYDGQLFVYICFLQKLPQLMKTVV